MPTMNLALPGTAYGPCLGECNHPRCARSRRTAVLICPHCDKEIGYGVDYIKEDKRNGALVHTKCAAPADQAFLEQTNELYRETR